MYVRASNILNSNLRLQDGKKAIRDLLVDDKSWQCLHVVVDTGDWLPGREVLLSPEALGEQPFEENITPAALSRADIEACDDITADEPVSRQKIYSMASYVGPLPPWSCDWNPHLRSVKELLGYAVAAHGTEDGTVADAFVWCGDEWTLRYLVVDMGSFFSPRLFLLPTPIVHEVTWDERRIRIYANRQTLSVVPEFEGMEQLTAGFESELHRIYQGRPGSWWREGERHG
jgi:hypothetical protein